MKFVVLFTLGLMGQVFAENLEIAKLAADETIRIGFSSQGCFHSSTETYQISGGSEKTFTVQPSKESAKKYSGNLTATEVRKLDALFQFYRKNDPGGCTTVDEIKVTYLRNGKAIGQESFVDASCQVEGNKDLISFYKVAKRLELMPAK